MHAMMSMSICLSTAKMTYACYNVPVHAAPRIWPHDGFKRLQTPTASRLGKKEIVWVGIKICWD